MNNKKIIPIKPLPDILLPEKLTQIGAAANESAARHRFEDYQSRRSQQTLRRQKADLNLFNQFLNQIGADTQDLFTMPSAWNGITWGLVDAFVKWQLTQGYAVQSVNVRLSTIKAYAKLAMQAGALLPQEYALIRSVSGYTQKEQRRIDQNRIITRIGGKKSSPVLITPAQAAALKSQPNTPQGRRDALLMCLLLDHGLRVGEVAILTVENIDLENGFLLFFRPKVDKSQKHRLSPDTLKAARMYAAFGDMPAKGLLLRRSLKNGDLGASGMSERAITERVKILGEMLGMGLAGLSAHDCRHYWATQAARHGTDPFVLQEAGGWSSLAMPRRYIEENEISNEGINLD